MKNIISQEQVRQFLLKQRTIYDLKMKKKKQEHYVVNKLSSI